MRTAKRGHMDAVCAAAAGFCYSGILLSDQRLFRVVYVAQHS